MNAYSVTSSKLLIRTNDLFPLCAYVWFVERVKPRWYHVFVEPKPRVFNTVVRCRGFNVTRDRISWQFEAVMVNTDCTATELDMTFRDGSVRKKLTVHLSKGDSLHPTYSVEP